jgi:hypothetical protein
MSIIITRNGADAQRLEPAAIEREEYVQQYIQQNPESLPLQEIDVEIRMLILARELQVPGGSIDVLGIDGEGRST